MTKKEEPKMKKILALFLAAVMLIGMAACSKNEKTGVTVNIGVLKGPTGMGAAWLMDQNEQGLSANSYNFTIAGAPDVLTGQLISGDMDMAGDGGHKRLRQHDNIIFAGEGKGRRLGVLGSPENIGGNAVLLKDIVEHVLCGAALTGGKNGFTLKVGNRIYSVAIFQNI